MPLLVDAHPGGPKEGKVPEDQETPPHPLVNLYHPSSLRPRPQGGPPASAQGASVGDRIWSSTWQPQALGNDGRKAPGGV